MKLPDLVGDFGWLLTWANGGREASFAFKSTGSCRQASGYCKISFFTQNGPNSFGASGAAREILQVARQIDEIYLSATVNLQPDTIR
jgi:hypothetical protein